MVFHIIFTHKIPDDDLSGLLDEEKLGFTYDDVKKMANEYETGIFDNSLDKDIREKILQKHQANLHKFYTPHYKRKY